MRRASLAALSLAAATGIQAGTEMVFAPAARAQAISVAPIGDEAPPIFSATVTQAFALDSNYHLDNRSPGTSYYTDTLLDLDYVRSTETQSLQFGLETGMRALWEADEDFEFSLASPSTANIGYSVEAPTTAFQGELRYRQRRTDFTRDPGDFITDPGVPVDTLDRTADTDERRLDVLLGLDLATDAPSSYSLNFTGTSIDYSKDDLQLVPRKTALGEADWTLRLNPVLSTVLGTSYYRYWADNQAKTETRTTEFTAGLLYQPDENIRLRGSVGYADRTREQTAAGERQTLDTNSGVIVDGNALFLQDTYNLVGDAQLTTAAPQTRFSFSLRGTYRLNRGTVTGRAFNRYTTEGDGESEVRVSGLGLGISRDINTVSRVNVDFAVAQETELDTDEEDTTTTSATVSYAYDLTPVIVTEVGYGYRSEVQDPDDADSHRLFFSIGRLFTAGL